MNAVGTGIATAIANIEDMRSKFIEERALVAGISIDELLHRENRGYQIGEIAKQLGVPWEQAEAIFGTMEEEKRREREEAHSAEHDSGMDRAEARTPHFTVEDADE